VKNKRLKKKRLGDIEFREGSENIFADIGIPNPEEAMAKAKIAMKISDIIKKKKLTQAKAAKILKVSQPKISLLLRGYLTDFSLERLLRFLNDLGQNVRISITPSSKRHGSTWIGDARSGVSIAALAR
jgi:predicted XRE-type DNA-binding protein